MYDLKGSKKLLSSTEDRLIFEGMEGSRPIPKPRPRTSKTVLEAATSGDYNSLDYKKNIKIIHFFLSRNLKDLTTCDALINYPSRTLMLLNFFWRKRKNGMWLNGLPVGLYYIVFMSMLIKYCFS